MKLTVTLAATAVLAAGPALAQAPASTGFGKPFGSPASSASKPRDYGVAPPVGSSRRPKAYAAPDAGGGFKPYQPYKPGSVYASPKPPSSGAKPCETSVYVNACDKRR